MTRPRHQAPVKGPPKVISREEVSRRALAFLEVEPRWWPVSDVVDHVCQDCENSRRGVIEDVREGLISTGQVEVRQLPERKPHPVTKLLYKTEWRKAVALDFVLVHDLTAPVRTETLVATVYLGTAIHIEAVPIPEVVMSAGIAGDGLIRDLLESLPGMIRLVAKGRDGNDGSVEQVLMEVFGRGSSIQARRWELA